ncbi:thiol-disulfide isomerase/thioredoxin [Pedobacter africanus]|uniref:Thiol-disulfide isomerase/thioredoxin n=1 Tax=Pedobacter africanus TaxID=151894 RepID=A0ACC6KS75_9SPHI|nr:TlpA disulfide reductase family protein [Pedobacter africanus]MDR6782203.1 thiol-disulfide isomerase/thioredoxin [Pedobacter africanus]
MKKLIMMSILCLYAGIVFGQKRETKVTIELTSIKPDSIWVADYGEVFFAKPDKDNKYVLHFKHDKPLKVRIGFDKPEKRSMTLYLEQGGPLNIISDFDKNSSFSGKDAENTRVLNECTNIYASAYQKKGEEIGDKILSPEDAVKTYYDLGQLKLNVLEANRQKVSKTFYDDCYISFSCEKLNLPILLPKYYVTPEKKFSKCIPASYWNLEKDIKVDDRYITNPNYERFMTHVFPAFLSNKEKFKLGTLDKSLSPEAELKLKMALVEKTYPEKLKRAALFGMVNAAVGSSKDLVLVKPLMDNYIAKYATEAQAKELRANYLKVDKLSAGKTPPPFVLKDLNGKDVTLKDFAGKVIYMDFWASWCSPCRYEMKNGSPKLHEKFKDNKDVVFLYISLDSKIDAWKKAIADDKIEGIHLLSQAKTGVDSAVGKAFNISGIPRYVIIGRDGKIFDNDAPRPSQDVTPAKINEALNKS